MITPMDPKVFPIMHSFDWALIDAKNTGNGVSGFYLTTPEVRKFLGELRACGGLNAVAMEMPVAELESIVVKYGLSYRGVTLKVAPIC